MARTCIRCSAPSSTSFAAQCGFCTPGMLMAAKALLDRNPAPSRDEVVEAISGNICRCTGYEPIIHAILAASGRAGSAPEETRSCWNLRKEYFADERDDNLKEIGTGTQRAGHARATSPARRAIFDDHKLPGHAASEGACAARRRMHALRRIDTAEAERHAGRAHDHPRRRRAASISTRSLSLINFGKDDEPLLAVDKVRYKGEPIVAIVADSEREAFEAIAKVQGRLRAAAGGVRRRGGAEARRARRQRDLSEEHLHLSRRLRSPEAALRRRRRGVCDGRSRAGAALPDVADRARADRDQRLRSPRPTPTAATSSTPRRRRCSSRSTPAPRSCDVPSNTLHFIGGTVGGGFGGKVDTLTEPLAILGAMLTGRPVRYVFGREEEMQIRPAARRRAHLHQGRRDAGRPHRRAQGPRLFRQRRLFAPLQLRRA